MSEWIPPGHRPHDGHPDDDVRWCECSGRCTQGAPCDCCELAELRAEVDSLRAGARVAQAAAGKRIAELAAELAERDRRIARALDLMGDRANSSPGYPLLERVLRGES